MQREYRIRKNGQFQYVYRKGRSMGCRELTLLYIKAQRLQVGFSVSKKVGNAVTRNKVKRRLREAFRRQIGDVKRGFYVIAARPLAAQSDFKTLSGSLKYLLRKQGLFKDCDAR